MIETKFRLPSDSRLENREAGFLKYSYSQTTELMNVMKNRGADSSTDTPLINNGNVASQIDSVFEKNLDLLYQDEAYDEFSRELGLAVLAWESSALDSVFAKIDNQELKGEVITKTFETLARLSHPPTYNFRLWMMERFLLHRSPRIRDGALLGLSIMKDKRALPYLQEAEKLEQVVELKRNINKVIRLIIHNG